jgi:hypothetical protein
MHLYLFLEHESFGSNIIVLMKTDNSYVEYDVNNFNKELGSQEKITALIDFIDNEIYTDVKYLSKIYLMSFGSTINTVAIESKEANGSKVDSKPESA